MSEVNWKFCCCHFIYKQIFITFNFILYEVTIMSFPFKGSTRSAKDDFIFSTYLSSAPL